MAVKKKTTAPKKPLSKEEKLTRAIHSLEKTIHSLPQHYDYVFHPWKSFGTHFMRGVAYGLGIIISFAVIIPLFISVLRLVEWVPLFGHFLSQLLEWMEQSQSIR